ncbi:MAG: HigA family addiction module antidote protein [Alphaproteobacteria bacterium]|nr:HigA family addiction module antidote protein [Alphaproteobacteria bacterium]
MWKSLTITGDEDLSPPLETSGRMKPVHPGEVLREDFLEPLSLSALAVAKACGVPRTRIERLAKEQTSVTADTALRLARYFSTSPQFWINLQSDYDLRIASKDARKELAKIAPLAGAAE